MRLSPPTSRYTHLYEVASRSIEQLLRLTFDSRHRNGVIRLSLRRTIVGSPFMLSLVWWRLAISVSLCCLDLSNIVTRVGLLGTGFCFLLPPGFATALAVVYCFSIWSGRRWWFQALPGPAVGGRFLEFIVKDKSGRGFAVTTRCCFGKYHSVLLARIISKWHGPLGKLSIMSVAVFHVCMKSQSGSASSWTRPLASVVNNTTPSKLGGISVCLATRVSCCALYASSTMVTSSMLSLSCKFWTYLFSVITTAAIIGTEA